MHPVSDPADRARHARLVALVEQTAAGVELHKRLAAEQVPHVKTVLQRQIEATDRQIDALVYELYRFTEERDPDRGGRPGSRIAGALTDR
jgi:hypothetical protein